MIRTEYSRTDWKAVWETAGRKAGGQLRLSEKSPSGPCQT